MTDWTSARVGGRLRLGLVAGLIGLSLSGCATPYDHEKVYQAERFESAETYSRLFDTGPADACEAARRALLGQGYVMNSASAELLTATKSFQPDGENHVQIVFNVVCVTEGAGRDGARTVTRSEPKAADISTVYVSAVQDRYNLKKSASSASVGLSALGSVSIPFLGGNDSMVKVGSETISSPVFYERFFALVQRHLADQLPAD